MELTKTTEQKDELQLQVTQQEERQEEQREFGPLRKLDAYRQQSKQMVDDGLVTVGEMHLRSMQKADELPTVRYQLGAEAQKAAKDKRYRDKVLKGLKKQDKESFQRVKSQVDDMQKVVASNNPNSPRSILNRAKDAYQSWRKSLKRMNIILFRKKMDEEYEAELRRPEDFKMMDVPTMEKIGGFDAQIAERSRQEEEEKKTLSSMEQQKEETETRQNMEMLLSEDPLLEIKREILERDEESDLLDTGSLDTASGYTRVDPFGIERREHMKQYAKSGRITKEDIRNVTELYHLQEQPIPESKKKLVTTLNEDIQNLLNNIRVDQIGTGEDYELPESLMTGLKGYTLFKGICENVGADKKLREAETKEKIKILEEQIKKFEEKQEELESREADIRTLIQKIRDNPMKTGKEKALKEKEDKLKKIEAQKEKVREEILQYEADKQELTEKYTQQKKEREEWMQFILDMQGCVNRQVNAYNRIMRQLKAIRIAKQIVADSPAGDYRDSMLQILTDMSIETEDQIDSAVRSIFQKKVDSTQTTKELTDQQLDIMMGLANLYDEIRAKREELPKKPADHEETPEEKSTREEAEARIKQEVQQMMDEARRVAES